MPNYILAYHGGKKPETPEEGAEGMAKFQAWVRDLGDAAINPGTPLGMSKTVSADGISDGISDGGGVNPMSGFSIVKAKDMDAALEIAKICPFLEMGIATIVVSEQMEMPQ